MHVCRTAITYRQLETRDRQGWGFNLGPGRVVFLNDSLAIYGAPRNETLRSLIERGEIDGSLFEEVNDNPPAERHDGSGDEG